MKNKQILLNLGCGTVAPKEWVNIDSSWNAWVHKFPVMIKIIKYMFPSLINKIDTNWKNNILIRNISRSLPFKDASVDGIYLSHVLEHLDTEKCQSVLNECSRILKPGKFIRVIVPDLLQLTNVYINEVKTNKLNAANNYLDSLHLFLPREKSLVEKIYFSLNDTDSHKWMYDKGLMVNKLKKSGFVHIRECTFKKSKILLIDKVEKENRFINAICLEGERE